MPSSEASDVMLDATAKSAKKAESGGEEERDNSKGRRRWTERLMASNWRKKGSSVVELECWIGMVWKSTCLTCGCWERKEAMWEDSAAETVGFAVINVTVQLRDKSMEAIRRKGVKWPIPALGKRAM